MVAAGLQAGASAVAADRPASVWLFGALVLLVGAERLVELVLSRRGAKRAFARGGKEYGREHFPAMVVLHSAFLLCCVLEVWLLGRPFVAAIGWPALLGVIVAMTLRYWAVLSLQGRWNARVICVPGDRVQAGGPYAYVRHPNYVAVVLEIAALPLVHSAYITAVAFSLLNAWMLKVRIAVEEHALGETTDYGERFAKRPRFVPGGHAKEEVGRATDHA